jgi:phytoene synthase
MVDGEEGLERGAPGELGERLARARQAVAWLYRELPELAVPGWPAPAVRAGSEEVVGPWAPAEFAALVDCIRRYRIPEQPFQELISGMEMDLTKRRYATWAELDTYCYRVAGVVGLMMAPVLGSTDERALGHAADMGRAMQLTNILRDVREDLEMGRVYLPASELAAFGLDEASLRRGVVDDRWRGFMRWQIARARAFYARAFHGLRYLDRNGQQVVRLMGGIYGEILRVIEERDYDVFRGRAYVPGGRKLKRALGALARPLWGGAAPQVDVPVPLLPTGAQP